MHCVSGDSRVVVKILRGTWTDQCRTALKEADVLHQAQEHPNFPLLLSLCSVDASPALVLEKAPLGDAWAALRDTSLAGFNTQQCRDVLCQSSRALLFLHGRGLAHADVKPNNILLCPWPRPERGQRGALPKDWVLMGGPTWLVKLGDTGRVVAAAPGKISDPHRQPLIN